MTVPTVKAPHELRHPNYAANQENWRKWRLTYEGGDRFIRQYLKKYSKRETNEEFENRKSITYCPAFAKSGINEVKNAIYGRMGDVTRAGGSVTYHDACAGKRYGVDMMGSTMSNFIGRRIIPELLVQGRVGVFVDMPKLDGTTKADVKGKHPYLYWYRAEDILSWGMDCNERPNEFTDILLADTTIEDDPDAFLPSAEARRYRHLWVDPDDGYVYAKYYNLDGTSCNPDGEDIIKLNLTRIPFVMLEISESLMIDVANYQVALLNLASSDVNAAHKSNFSLYVEQFDNRTESPNIKSETPNQYFNQSTGINATTGSIQIVSQENTNAIRVGPQSGRKYPIGTNQPAFINPSSEPLTASMNKQAQMKQEIRELIALAVSNLSPTTEGPTDAGFDASTIESGLSYIGLELEVAERKIAEFWAIYEGPNSPIAEIFYPENYSIVSEAQRLESADQYLAVLPKLPSKTFQKEMAKKTIRVLLENKVPHDVLVKMLKEIDDAIVISVDPEVIKSDFESGFVGLDTASQARGYPKGEVEMANKDHADRIARIAISQSEGGGAGAENAQARGTSDLGANNKAGSQEKKASLDTTKEDTVTNKQRGEGK